MRTRGGLILPYRRPDCTAMATIRRAHCALFERCCNDVCFKHAQSALRRSAFYTIPQRPLAMPLRCCGDACGHTARASAICIVLGRRGIDVRTLLWCDRGSITHSYLETCFIYRMCKWYISYRRSTKLCIFLHLNTFTLRDVCYNARWFWTTVRYGFQTKYF